MRCVQSRLKQEQQDERGGQFDSYKDGDQTGRGDSFKVGPQFSHQGNGNEQALPHWPLQGRLEDSRHLALTTLNGL